MRKLLFAGKLAVISICAFASCASKKAKAAEPPPCHNGGITQVRTAEKLVITTCTFVQPCVCDSQEIVFSELKGAKGDRGAPGDPGPRGGQGPAGPMRTEEKIAWCRHDTQTHRNHTLHATPTEIISKYGGYYGALDFSGECGEWEGKCSCDAPVCRNENPSVHHYLTDGVD